jgi:chitinase
MCTNLIMSMCAASSTQLSSPPILHHHQRHLPPVSNSPIIIGYAHDAKSGKAEQAILDGINVIIWSFVHLDVVDNEEYGTTALEQQHDELVGDDEAYTKQQRAAPIGKIRSELDFEEIQRIRNKYDHVVHLAALGGWNGPHPPPNIMSGTEWCHVFLKFNQAHGHLFDGIDWDYEGHDDVTAPTAQFTIETLDIMVDFSLEAKRHGLIVSMAPAESYMDSTIQSGSTDEQFSLALNLPPRAWTTSNHASDEDRAIVASNKFSHAGRQCYAYVLAKAGKDTFDWISIQFYEVYSPFAHDIHRRNLDPVDALMMRIHRLVVEGYTVTNLPLVSPSSTTSLEYELRIPFSKLVLGIANGWADGLKFCKIDPSAVKSTSNAALDKYGQGYLGVMFWTIEEEGSTNDRRMTYLLNQEFKRNGEL